MRTKLTKRVCLDVEPDHSREEIYWDEDGSGLGVRVTKKRVDGRRGRYFVFGYRTRIRAGDAPRKSKWRIYALGTVGRWTLKKAKAEVIRLNALVNEGADPVQDRQRARQAAGAAKTMRDLAVLVMERHHGTTWEEPPPVGRKKVEPKYVRTDRSQWKRWVLPRLESMLVTDVTTNHVDDLLRDVSEQAGTTSANRLRAMLSVAFNKAEAWKLRPQNTNPVVHAMKHDEQRRDRILSRDELIRVLNAADELLEEVRQAPTNGKPTSLSEQRQLLAIQLAAETLRRPAEIFKLQWRWIRFDDQVVALPKAKPDRKGKRAKGQSFGLSDRAMEILRKAEAIAGDSPFVFPSTRSNSSGYIVSVQRMWAAILQRAGIEDKLDQYTLKHTLISLSDEAGVQLGSVSDQAGHGDIRTTEIYRRGSDERKVAAANSLSRYVDRLRRDRRDDRPPPHPS